MKKREMKRGRFILGALERWGNSVTQSS